MVIAEDEHNMNSREHSLNRARVLMVLACWLSLFTCGVPGLATTAPSASDRVNILFISIDDLNDWVGFLGGHPQAKTPNMDRLAARGIAFTNAHCAAPICCPSRAAVFSGRQPFNTGVYTNGDNISRIAPELVLLPKQMKAHGYRTWGTGKLLHRSRADLFDEFFKPEQRWSPFSSSKPLAYTPEELPSKGSDDPRHVVDMGPDRAPIVLPLNRMPSDRRPREPGAESFDWGPFDVPDSAMGDCKIVDWAAKRLNEASTEPFFLALGFYRPHIPLWAPTKYFEPFPSTSIQLPPILANDLDDLGPLGREVALLPKTAGAHATVLKYNQWEAAVAAYLACVHFVDAQLGRLLDALESSGHGDNTAIIIWGDHGWHLGEKQHWGKSTGWERATRVPLLIAPPARTRDQYARGQLADEAVSLIDLYPTVLEVANVPPPSTGLDGKSLMPLLRDPNLETGRAVISTFRGEHFSVGDQRWRYIRYADGSEELYDHRVDPNEWRNLAADPASRAVKARLARVLPKEPKGHASRFPEAPTTKTITPLPKTVQDSSGPVAFGNWGQLNMLYDRRQRPQAVYLDNKVHVVYAGRETAPPPTSRKIRTQPMVITYDPLTRTFSEPITLGPGDSDHHFTPIIWADRDDYLHILFGCHKTPGMHLVSKEPASIGNSRDAWTTGAQIAPSMSYPSYFRIHGNRELIHFRTVGHSSSWTYRISNDQGKTWREPANDVTDMDLNFEKWPEWSSYQTKLPTKDGKCLYVAFFTYDDVKSNDPKRLYNPRYHRPVTNEWKYNLYLIKIDLQTHAVTNFDGQALKTPIDLDQANEKCMIWNTDGRGAGVPPAIMLDEKGNPAFLHVLSEETLQDHQYYYVRRAEGTWKKTPITRSNHQWNSCHIAKGSDGILHAYIITDDGYLDSDGKMDSHGGGRLEEWTSADKGNTWNKARDLTPDRSRYPGWKYNNIQPIRTPEGSIVDGMLLFYGWKDKNAPKAKAFLLHE